MANYADLPKRFSAKLTVYDGVDVMLEHQTYDEHRVVGEAILAVVKDIGDVLENALGADFYDDDDE